jgi:hypothetical protein
MTAPETTTTTAPAASPPRLVPTRQYVSLSFFARGLEDYEIGVRITASDGVIERAGTLVEIGCSSMTLDEWAGDMGDEVIDEYYDTAARRTEMRLLRDQLVAELRPKIAAIRAGLA